MSSLYLDDKREPGSNFDIVIRNSVEFKDHILKNGVPNFISFDNDLGLDENGELYEEGYDCAKWLVDHIMDNDIELPKDFSFYVHSANNIAKEKINNLLNNFIEHQKKINNNER